MIEMLATLQSRIAHETVRTDNLVDALNKARDENAELRDIVQDLVLTVQDMNHRLKSEIQVVRDDLSYVRYQQLRDLEREIEFHDHN